MYFKTFLPVNYLCGKTKTWDNLLEKNEPYPFALFSVYFYLINNLTQKLIQT